MHRLDDAPLRRRDAEDLVDALDRRDDRGNDALGDALGAPASVPDRGPPEQVARERELVQDQLEPELVHLVHDDEEHFVVVKQVARRERRGRGLLEVGRKLGAQQPVELQVGAVRDHPGG